MRPDQLEDLAKAIYVASFEGWAARAATPWADLPDDAKAIWLRCARAASAEESRRCSRIARMHMHHALWTGLLPFFWTEEVERFGRGLAYRIETSILDKGATR